MKYFFSTTKILIILCVLIVQTGGATMLPVNVLHSETQVLKDDDGEVRVTLDWLESPGEMALTIDYYGYLTQEGMANIYLQLNGEERQFLTMLEELPDRSQRIKVMSYHPTVIDNGVNKIAPLPGNIMVDSLLFRNAAYYAQFGPTKIEMKFFCHSRWDGDSSNDNHNFVFVFNSPITDFRVDHF